MVCHETYKDGDGNWISPDEVVTLNNKKYLKKINQYQLKLVHQNLCLNQRILLSRRDYSKLWSRFCKIIYFI